VLDTYHGVAAAGVAIELTRLGETRRSLARIVTDANGRSPAAAARRRRR
jgi:5-hydroxyisourate hydrolase-like protein (transthyretin family)